jgi:hypothetical protein
MRVAVLADMTAHPVEVEVISPPRFERLQLLLRVALAIVLGWIGITAGWLVCVLFGALPLIAAIVISSGGGERYLGEVAPRLWRVLAWLLQLSAYMLLLVDRFPTGPADDWVRLQIRFTGKPTVGSALLRFITSIPSGLVLMLLWFVSWVLWVASAVLVLFGSPLPESILGFQRGVLRWNARLVAYHASLVEEYPPFTLDTGGDGIGRPVAPELQSTGA